MGQKAEGNPSWRAKNSRNRKISGIFAHQLLFHGEVVGRADHLMDVANGLGCQSFGLLLGFDSVYSPTFQQVLVEPL